MAGTSPALTDALSVTPTPVADVHVFNATTHVTLRRP
jgi:3-dehydroquinate dehydratase